MRENLVKKLAIATLLVAMVGGLSLPGVAAASTSTWGWVPARIRD